MDARDDLNRNDSIDVCDVEEHKDAKETDFDASLFLTIRRHIPHYTPTCSPAYGFGIRANGAETIGQSFYFD